MTDAEPSSGDSRPPPSVRLQLSGAPESLVIPLYARALDFRSKHSILHDQKADELVRSIDFDFERHRSPGSPRILVARARQYDEWVRDFLGTRPSGLVLNLGCGLDSRAARVRPPSSSLWVDLDFPEVVTRRRDFFAEAPGYRMVGASLTSSDWIGALPADRPMMSVADGVFEYLAEDEVRGLVGRLATHFASSVFVFDVMNSSALVRGNERLRATSGARLRWAVDDLARVDAWNPSWRRTADVSALRLRFLPMRDRVLFGLASLSSRARGAIRLVRYET